jgi:hypothetical protein
MAYFPPLLSLVPPPAFDSAVPGWSPAAVLLEPGWTLVPMAPGGVVVDSAPAALVGVLLPGAGAPVAPWKPVVAGGGGCARAPASGTARRMGAKKSVRHCVVIVPLP